MRITPTMARSMRYNSLPPDQVVANVQAALQEQGYYQGDVDGLLGPLTREAIAGYQRSNGLSRDGSHRSADAGIVGNDVTDFC